jgi:hypothetical protein
MEHVCSAPMPLPSARLHEADVALMMFIRATIELTKVELHVSARAGADINSPANAAMISLFCITFLRLQRLTDYGNRFKAGSALWRFLDEFGPIFAASDY